RTNSVIVRLRPGVFRRASVLACSCTSEDACATEKPVARQDISPCEGGSILAKEGEKLLHRGATLGRHPLEVHLPIRYLPERAIVQRHQLALYLAQRLLRRVRQVGPHEFGLGRPTVLQKLPPDDGLRLDNQGQRLDPRQVLQRQQVVQQRGRRRAVVLE